MQERTSMAFYNSGFPLVHAQFFRKDVMKTRSQSHDKNTDCQ